MATHTTRRQVRHRHHRPDPDKDQNRSLTPAGRGRGPLEAGVQDLARSPDRLVSEPSGDRRDGRIHRIQQDIHGHRGRAQDPLYRARRTLHTGADLLTPRQQARLDALFTGDDHVQLEATYGVYQQLVAAYRDPDRANGRARMEALIASISSGVPGALREVITLGRTLKKRATDVLAYFDRPGTSNGPTEALKCRCRHFTAYADVWIMPTVTTSALVGTGWVGGLSA